MRNLRIKHMPRKQTSLGQFPKKHSAYRNWCRSVLPITLAGCVLGTSLIGCAGGNSSVTPKATTSNPVLDSQTRQAIADNDAAYAAFKAKIARIEPHITRNADGTLTLASTEARTADLSAENQQFAQGSLNQVNALIVAKKATSSISADRSISIVSTDPDTRANGKGLRLYWWGIGFQINDAGCSKLIYAMEVGGATSALILVLAGIPSPPTAIVAASGAVIIFLLAIGAATVNYYAHPGRGIEIGVAWYNNSYSGHTGAYIRSQD